jgi:hypothetical protein
LPKHGQAQHVDQRMTEFVIKDAHQVGLDKGLAFFLGRRRLSHQA